MPFRWNKAASTYLLFASGLALAAAPWLFGHIADQAAAFSSKVLAAGMLLVGLAAYVELKDWALRGAVVVALCSFAAPVLLGFNELAAAAWTHGGAGALAILAAYALLRTRRADASSHPAVQG